MRSNIQDKVLYDNVTDLDNNLSSIEKALKHMIHISVEEIKNDPTKEKELISLWANHASNISDFFFQECQRTDNKGLYKNIVKYILFNK